YAKFNYYLTSVTPHGHVIGETLDSFGCASGSGFTFSATMATGNYQVGLSSDRGLLPSGSKVNVAVNGGGPYPLSISGSEIFGTLTVNGSPIPTANCGQYPSVSGNDVNANINDYVF